MFAKGHRLQCPPHIAKESLSMCAPNRRGPREVRITRTQPPRLIVDNAMICVISVFYGQVNGCAGGRDDRMGDAPVQRKGYC